MTYEPPRLFVSSWIPLKLGNQPSDATEYRRWYQLRRSEPFRDLSFQGESPGPDPNDRALIRVKILLTMAGGTGSTNHVITSWQNDFFTTLQKFEYVEIVWQTKIGFEVSFEFEIWVFFLEYFFYEKSLEILNFGFK